MNHKKRGMVLATPRFIKESSPLTVEQQAMLDAVPAEGFITSEIRIEKVAKTEASVSRYGRGLTFAKCNPQDAV